MEGTLSLFDWRPAPVPVSESSGLAEGSGPHQRVLDAEGGSPDAIAAVDVADEIAQRRARGSAGRRSGSRKARGAVASPPSAPDEARDALPPAIAEPPSHAAAQADRARGTPAADAAGSGTPAIESAAARATIEIAAMDLVRAVVLPIDAPPPSEEQAPAASIAAASAAVIDLAIPAALLGLRVVIFDCETTGTDRMSDQVIELCVQHGLADDAPSRTWRIKPTAPIHPGAQAVHGITAADLAGCPPFAELAEDIAAVFREADVIVGYNIAFDIDMLQAEYTRIGKPLLDLTSKKVVDAFRLWQQCEPRSLQHAHQRFVGNGFASAHSASADVAATGRVLTGMLRAFQLGDHDWDAIAGKCDSQAAARASWVGPSRHLRWEGEVVVLGFGKYANAVLHQLAAGPDRSFLRWVVERDFPVHVGEICRAALDLPGEEFLAWARRRFPPPAAAAAR